VTEGMRNLFILGILMHVVLPAQIIRPDDPLENELAPISVGELARRRLSDYYDTISHTVSTPGDLNRARPEAVPAQGVNTLGEPMQGAWWVKRHYYRRMSIPELIAGPGNQHPPSTSGPWTVVGAKGEGVTPGFLMMDAKQQLYFIKFDPITNPEMASGADHIAVRLLYALGYHVPDNYLVEFPSNILQIGKEAKIGDRLGRRRSMTQRDLDEMLLKVPQTSGRKYRATASRAISGTSIGPYRYYGTRRDDPNDFIPHEHRRDLRGLAVISAWMDHDDSRAINTFDAVVEEGGRRFVKHYILDLGSTLGSGTERANSPRSGGEYLFSWKDSAVQLFTLGLAIQPWAKAQFPELPAVGRFEYATFDPETWLPEYPNPAFLNRLPDDEFWAAKQIMALRDEEIRAVVASARYSDPRAADWITECLIQRRDKVGQAYFKKVLPLDSFAVQDRRLIFEDLSAKAGLPMAGSYDIEWLQLDNSSGNSTPLKGALGPGLPQDGGEYVIARIRNAARPGQSIDVTVRRGGNIPPAVVAVSRKWKAEPEGSRAGDARKQALIKKNGTP
jgi:hypothetical protein